MLRVTKLASNTFIQTRVVYVEHYARWGTLSKANQTITSDLLRNSDPLNMDHLHSKHPEPVHPNRDPVCKLNMTVT